MRCLGPGMVVQFSPKILGLNAGIFGTILGSLGTDLQTAMGPCVRFLCVIVEKGIRCWLCVNYVIIYVYDTIT